MKQNKILKNRFIVLEELGSGGYGTVNKALDKDTQKYVAVKFVKIIFCNFQNRKLRSFKHETGILEIVTKYKFPGKKVLIT